MQYTCTALQISLKIRLKGFKILLIKTTIIVHRSFQYLCCKIRQKDGVSVLKSSRRAKLAFRRIHFQVHSTIGSKNSKHNCNQVIQHWSCTYLHALNRSCHIIIWTELERGNCNLGMALKCIACEKSNSRHTCLALLLRIFSHNLPTIVILRIHILQSQLKSKL